MFGCTSSSSKTEEDRPKAANTSTNMHTNPYLIVRGDMEWESVMDEKSGTHSKQTGCKVRQCKTKAMTKAAGNVKKDGGKAQEEGATRGQDDKSEENVEEEPIRKPTENQQSK